MKVERFYKLILLCVALLLQVSDSFSFQNSSLLQNQIVISRKKSSVREILEKVFPENNVPISYHDNIIPLKKVISFKKDRSYSVGAILDRICTNEDLDFEETNGQIYLKFYERPDDEYEYTVYGRVKDADSGEPLIGATVYIRSMKSGVATNGYGVYSITLPKKEHELIVSFVGYKTVNQHLETTKNVQYDFSLNAKSVELEDVVIGATDFIDLKAVNILSSTNRLDMTMAENIPYLGEVDVFQGSLLLPGLTNIGEGSSGINVRGGAADQNLIMLDEAVVYNSNHFFGLVSVFNPDAVQDVEILKGDLHAKYGGRNSSVMHIRQKEGNENEFHLSGGLGLLTSRLMTEGPMLNRNASYLVSARSTFWDLLLRNSRNATLNDIRANFQDLNAKVKFNINNNNKVYFASYFGNDTNKLGTEALKRWGNRIVSARWNNIYKNKHFFNVTSYFSRYSYRVTDKSELAGFVEESKISDAAFKVDITSYFNPKNILEYGVSMITHIMNPGKRFPGLGSAENEVTLPVEYGYEPSIYLSSENQLSTRLTSMIGLRFSSFYNTGNADLYVYDKNFPRSKETILDTLSRGSNRARNIFHNLLPRVLLKYQIDTETSIKAGFFQTVQYMHLLSNTISPSSADTWKISGEYLPPTTMKQSTLGVYRYFRTLDFTGSVEFFYKKLNNTTDFKNGADLLFNETIETELLFGEERVYGLELFAKKSFGRLNGWIGYTLSKSEKRVAGDFEEEIINGGAYFPTDFDRTHDVAITAIYKLNERLSLSSNFVYYTGRPYSFPDSKYDLDGILVPHFPDRNQQRLASYNRLDVSATLKNKKIKRNGEPRKYESSWVFSIYNIYNRRNAQAYFFTHKEEEPSQPEVQRLSILGSVIPSVTYNFRF